MASPASVEPRRRKKRVHAELVPEQPASLAAYGRMVALSVDASTAPVRLENVARAAAVDSSSTLVVADAMLDAWRELRQRLDAMQPQYRQEGQAASLTQQDAHRGLRMRYLFVPVYGAAHESALLMQAGRFQFGAALRDLPPCLFGRTCVATRMDAGRPLIPQLTEPITLMRAMTPAQLDELVLEGRAPRGRAPCVLCHRFVVSAYVHFMRTMRPGVVPEGEARREVAQLWCNRVDCADGYRRQAILLPRDDEVVMNALVEPTLRFLRAHRHGTQWRVHQEALVWRPPEIPAPLVGESKADFLARSRRDISRQQLPDCLLRELDCPNLPPALYEAVRRSTFMQDIAACSAPLVVLFSKAHNSRCLRRKYGTVAERLLFASARKTQQYSEVCAKQRVNGLKSGEVPEVLAEYESYGVRRRDVVQLVLASLCGDYAHSQTHLSAAARQRMAQLLLPFLGCVLHVLPALLLWCVRDFIVHCVLDDLALYHQIAPLTHFDAFRVLVGDVMARIRTYVEWTCTREWSALGRLLMAIETRPRVSIDASNLHRDAIVASGCVCLQWRPRQGGQRPPCAWLAVDGAREVQAEMAALLLPFHERALRVQYQKPRTDDVHWVVSDDVRKVARLVPRQRTEPEPDEKLEDQEQLEDDMAAVFDLARRTTGCSLSQLQALREQWKERQQLERKRQQTEAHDLSVIRNAHDFITPAEFEVLRDAVGRSFALSATDGPLVALVARVFPVLRVDAAVIAEMVSVLVSHRVCDTAKAARRAQLVALRCRDPRAYNLMQVAAELLKTLPRELRDLGRESLQCVRTQIAAVRSKTLEMLQHLQRCQMRSSAADHKDELERVRREYEAAGRPLDADMVRLWWCHVCQHVYSPVRRRAGRRGFYRFGLENAARDYAVDGRTYCRNTLINHRGSCRGRPLDSCLLLGRRLLLAGQAYWICPGCGDIAAGSPCAYMPESALGVCAQCATVVQAVVPDPLVEYWAAHPVDTVCACCQQPAQAAAHLFPHGAVVCRQHGTPWLIQRFQQLAGGSLATREQVKHALHTLHTDRRTLKRAAEQPALDKKMRMFKRRRRQTKRGC